jgi:hypothetical protein
MVVIAANAAWLSNESFMRKSYQSESIGDRAPCRVVDDMSTRLEF